MQYVGSPQTTFRFGSTPTRSMSISSLASMAESAEEPEDGDHGETAAHYFSRRFSVGSFHQRRRSGSVQSLSSMDGARAGSVGNNLSVLGSSAEGYHRARPPRPGRAQSARGGMLSESLGRQHSSRSVSQSPTSSNPTSPHHSNVNLPHANARAPLERRSSLGRAGYTAGAGYWPETRVVGFGEGSTTTTSPRSLLSAEEAEATRAQRAYLGASDDGDGDEKSAPGDGGGGKGKGARSGMGRGGDDVNADDDDAAATDSPMNDDAYETASDFFPQPSVKSAGVLVSLLHCVSFTSALIIAAPLPLLPRAVDHLGYSPGWTGAVFGAFAVGTVAATKAFNSFTNADGGRAALMIVGLFLQGAAGMLFGVAGELGFSDPASVLCMFIACRAAVGVGVATTHLAVYAAINGSMGSDPVRLKRTLKVNELFVALGFAAAGPLVSWLSIVGDSYKTGGSAASPAAETTLGGNNPNGSATYLGVGGFRLPFQVTGFLVLGNAVWLAGDPGCLAAGTRREWLDALLDEEFESVEARAAELSANRAERGEGVADGGADGGAESIGRRDGGGWRDAGVEVSPQTNAVTSRRQLLGARLVAVGGALFLACVAFGFVQPMLSLYLVDHRGFAAMENGWAQFAVAGGYLVGLVAVDVERTTSSDWISLPETTCAAGVFVAGCSLAAIGVADALPDAVLFAILAVFGVANAHVLAPALEGMKRAAADARGPGANVTEGAVRLYNVFQDAGQVFGPVAGGLMCAGAGFEGAAAALGAAVCLYGVLALSYAASLARPASLDGGPADVAGSGSAASASAASRRLPRPSKSDASLEERLLGYDYDGSAESSMG